MRCRSSSASRAVSAAAQPCASIKSSMPSPDSVSSETVRSRVTTPASFACFGATSSSAAGAAGCGCFCGVVNVTAAGAPVVGVSACVASITIASLLCSSAGSVTLCVAATSEAIAAAAASVAESTESLLGSASRGPRAAAAAVTRGNSKGSRGHGVDLSAVSCGRRCRRRGGGGGRGGLEAGASLIRPSLTPYSCSTRSSQQADHRAAVGTHLPRR